ncbi:hypothetical protein GCM10027449_04290 [Sinomonas notoginsengisoli]|uniref:NTP transferase domain-containing protein n=1 Tax=Sinomonas notoginsengisoli TaxID=1457311 RepID=UPI001F2110B3|nr:NTP transferase domain-containing protein [Sinomonas notoginsengisoli]
MESIPRPGVGGLTHDGDGSPAADPSPAAAVGFDAVILAGGRASRLGGFPKPQLAYRGATLLEHALDAVATARLTAVVGPGPGEPGGPAPLSDALPCGPASATGCVPAPEARAVLYTREEPAYAGPLAALASGLAALLSAPGTPPGWVAVLAADLPRAQEAAARLLAAAAEEPAADGVLGVDEGGHVQPLLAVYRSGPLAAVLEELSAEGGLADRPLRHLIARLDLLPLRLPGHVSDDVDTWEAARHWGIEGPGRAEAPGATPRQEEAHE